MWYTCTAYFYVYLLASLHICTGTPAGNFQSRKQFRPASGGNTSRPQVPPIFPSQGKCPDFVGQCYKTCFSLAKTQGLQYSKVGVRCSLSPDASTYSVACQCGSQDQTQSVLSSVPIPVSSTTISTTKTALFTTVTTATSKIDTTTTQTIAAQTSACSFTTVIIVLTSTTMQTAAASVATILSTSTVSTTVSQDPVVFTSTVPAAVVAVPTTYARKRVDAGTAFCAAFKAACLVECFSQGSVPKYDVCKAVDSRATDSRYSISCVCRQNQNLLQAAISGYNRQQPERKCTSVATTQVPATTTVTNTVVTSVVVVSTTTVPSTFVSTILTTTTSTSFYTCFTTTFTTSPTTIITTPIVTTTDVVTNTVVVTAVPNIFNVAVTGTDGTPFGYVSTSRSYYETGRATKDRNAAQQFVLLKYSDTDDVYNFVGLGADTEFFGRSLGAEFGNGGSNAVTPDSGSLGPFYVFLESTSPDGRRSPSGSGSAYDYGTGTESAIWKVDLRTLAAVFTWTNGGTNSGSESVLQGFVTNDGLQELGGASDVNTFGQFYYDSSPVQINYSLVPV